MLTSDDKLDLIDRLSGTTHLLTAAMRSLNIIGRPDEIRVELEDSIKPCVTCSRWTDVDLIEQGRCPRCDEVLNPANKPDGIS